MELARMAAMAGRVSPSVTEPTGAARTKPSWSGRMLTEASMARPRSSGIGIFSTVPPPSRDPDCWKVGRITGAEEAVIASPKALSSLGSERAEKSTSKAMADAPARLNAVTTRPYKLRGQGQRWKAARERASISTSAT